MATRLTKDDREPWRMFRHLELLARKLIECIFTPRGRLIITMPPRYGKSELTSHWTPVWLFEMMPWIRLALCGYGTEFASEWGLKVRETIKANHKDLDVRISKKKSKAGDWQTTDGGRMFCAGIGGPITGKGCDVGIVDDPLKNWRDAYSPTIRKGIWEWYCSTFRTRMQRGASIIIMLTRWHEDDLAGRLQREALENGGEHFEVLDIPCECIDPENDPLNRKRGELIDERMWPREEMEPLKKFGFVWWALYMQRPQPGGVRMFPEDGWSTFDEIPDVDWFDFVVMSYDCAFKDLATSDYVVGTIWGFKDASAYLIGVDRGQWDIVKTMASIERMAERYPKARAKFVEAKANGDAVVQLLRKKVRGLILVEPEGGKLARAASIQPYVASGNVLIPNPKKYGWVRAFVSECHSFPGGANDDQVDSMTQALVNVWLKKRVVTGKLKLPDKGLRAAGIKARLGYR